ncbi:MAG TPA: hypothetical protein VK737_01370 [Opitutales bacterium]|nr:hypothetical protein [Opitutales bacterium]
MNFPAFRTGSFTFLTHGRSLATMGLCATVAWLASARAADAPAASEFKVIDRTNFACKYPTAWKEATDDPDYKAESHFTLNGPDKTNSYVSFDIVDKTTDPIQLLASTITSLDGTAITALDKTKIEEWGQYKGSGIHMKGKILGEYPGGIKVFIFNSDHHNIMVIEYYWADELKDLTADIEFIQNNFTMKN